MAAPAPAPAADGAPLRVLYALGYCHRLAGSQRSLLETVSHLPSSVTPIVVVTTEGIVAEAFRARGVEVHVLPVAGELAQYGKAALRWSLPTKISVGVRRYLPYVLAACALVRRLDVDLVHVNDPRAALLFGAAARLARVPTVTHVRGEIAISRTMWRAVEALSDRLITVSRALQGDLTAAGRRKSVAVYNGTPLLGERGTAPPWLAGLRRRGVVVVACFAQVTPFKGYHHLADAIAELDRRGLGERAVFIAVGDIARENPRYTEWLFERIRRAGLRNLTFVDWQSDPWGFYLAADLTVLPSVSRESIPLDDGALDVVGNEGFPRTHLEAMAHGLPIVGTAIAGVREQVEDGVTGLLVPPADPIALADALEALITDPARRRQMGAAGRARVARLFSIEACVTGVVATYRSLLGGVT